MNPLNEKFFRLIHTSSEKHSELDISARCDICGDSKKDKTKKRLHLYTKPNWDNDSINCFNCGYTGTPYQYFKEYHPEIFNQYKNEINNNKLESINFLGLFETSKETESSKEIISSFKLDILTPPFLFNKPTLKELPEVAREYLNKRGLVPEDNWVYSDGLININGTELRLFNHIIIPFTYLDKWYGFQAVNIEKKQYFIYLPVENNGFKIWNLYNIDYSEPVYIFESILDAKSSGHKNIVAVMGITINEEILKLFSNPIFCFDNQQIDEASYRESEKLLKQGKSVFIWPKSSKSFKDFNDIAKKRVQPEKIARFIDTNIFSGIEGLIKLKLL